MSVYLINYYLKEEHDCGCENHDEHEHHHHHHEDYELIGELKALGSWAHLMPTSFLLQSTLSETEIFDKLKVTIKEKDTLFVSKLDGQATACSIPQAVEWISNH